MKTTKDIMLSHKKTTNILAYLKTSRHLALWLVLSMAASFFPNHVEAAPTDLGISQFDDIPDPVIAGSTVTYEIKVDNGQFNIAEDTKVDILFPPIFEFVAATSSLGLCSFDAPNQLASCALGNFHPQSSVDIQLTLRAIVPGPTTANITATISSSSEDPNPDNNSQTEETTIIEAADLSVTLDAAPNPATLGSLVSYAATINNAGPNVSNSLTLTDTLPPELSYTGFSGNNWQCSQNGQQINCIHTATVPAGGQASVLSLDTEVVSVSSGTLSNSVIVESSDIADPNQQNNTATHQLSLISGADLVLEKTVSRRVINAEDPISFLITATNQGSVTSENIVVTDALPSGLTAITANGNGWNCSLTNADIHCELSSLVPGASSAITVTAIAPSSSELPQGQLRQTNTALITTTTTETHTDNNTASVNYTVVAGGADLFISKEKTTGTISQGTEIESIIYAGNDGPGSVSGPIQVTDALENGEQFVSASGSGWQCSYANNLVSCEHSGSLQVGEVTPNLTIITLATGTGSLTNTACVSTDNTAPEETDYNQTNNCESKTVNSSSNLSDLSLTKTVDKSTLNPEDNSLTYTLTITNNGPDEAEYIRLNDRILMDAPATEYRPRTGLTIIAEQGSCSASSDQERYVYCEIGTLQPNESSSVTITVTRPMMDGEWDFEAETYSSTSDDPDETNNVASAPVTILPATDLFLQSKTVLPEQIIAGGSARYTLNFRNNGPSLAQNVTLNDIFTTALEDFTITNISTSKGSCSGSAETKTIDCAIGELTSEETQSIIIDIESKTSASEQIVNTANISADTYDVDESNNQQSATLDIRSGSLDLLVNISDDVDPLPFNPLAPETNLTVYTIRVDNLGPAPATNVLLANEIIAPTGKTIRFICDTNTGANGCPDLSSQVCSSQGTTFTTVGTVQCQIGEVTSTQAYYRDLIFQIIDLPEVGGDTYTMQVSVSSDQADSDASNDSSQELTTSGTSVDLAISEMKPSISTVNLNQPFEWQITVINNGPGDSRQTQLINALPPETIITGPPQSSLGECSINNGTNIMSCDFGYVTNSQEIFITIPAVVNTYPENNVLTSTATVSTAEIDIDLSNNTRVATVSIQGASISSSVYHDKNNNGIKDPGEDGIADIVLSLSGTDIYGNSINISATTQSDGSVIFDHLPPSDNNGYTLTEETQPVDFIDGLESIAGVIILGSIGSDSITNIIIEPNATLDTLFGEQSPSVPGTGSLSGSVFNDINSNGVQEIDEPGIEGSTITLSGTTQSNQAISITTQTNAAGQFTFLNLEPGAYTLSQTQPPALIDGSALVGDIGGTEGINQISNIPVQSGSNGSNYRFTEHFTRLAGLVYFDSNSNNTLDSGEPGIEGVTITLTGQDGEGTAIARETQTGADGSFTFESLPASNAAGYTLTETQPETFIDGAITIGSAGGLAAENSISNITLINTTSAEGYLFGEKESLDDPPNTARISGTVWLDENHDRIVNEANTGQAGWVVQLYQRSGPINNSTAQLIAETVTDDSGNYIFDSIASGSRFEVRFTHPEGYVYGTPVSSLPTAETTYGAIRNITLADNDNIIDQNLPVDPSGVVYNTSTRQPVAGASIRISGPAGFDPSLHLVGGSNNQTQVTDATGYYQFLFLTDAPTGTYSINVNAPDGYIPRNSTRIPACENALDVLPAPDPAVVHEQVRPPGQDAPIHDPANCPSDSSQLITSASSTQYFFNFNITPATSGNVVSNHIALDPLESDTITAIKTSPKDKVVRGEIVPYTLRFTNNLPLEIHNVALRDSLPAGFKYISDSAKLDGISSEPSKNGLELTWPGVTFTANQTRIMTMMLIAGAGVDEGEYVNRTWAYSFAINQRLSNIATATVLVGPDPLFECSDLIGKVYDDQNINGYPDKDEPGIPGVSLATARGLQITTDQFGRYHIACAMLPNRLHGSNFIIKLDERSLPSGFRVTTENPRVVKLTEGKLEKVNFGATIHRVIRLDLGPKAFVDSQTLSPSTLERLTELVDILRQKPSILRIAYIAQDESESTIQSQLDTFEQALKDRWDECNCGQYELIIESEHHRNIPATKVGKQPRRQVHD